MIPEKHHISQAMQWIFDINNWNSIFTPDITKDIKKIVTILKEQKHEPPFELIMTKSVYEQTLENHPIPPIASTRFQKWVLKHFPKIFQKYDNWRIKNFFNNNKKIKGSMLVWK